MSDDECPSIMAGMLRFSRLAARGVPCPPSPYHDTPRRGVRRNTLVGLLLMLLVTPSRADDQPAAVADACRRAGKNRRQIELALAQAPPEQQRSMRFLVANMPGRDLTSLSAAFLLENVDYAHRARQAAPWKDRLPEAVFQNYVLPYANVTESRDNWRKDFRERFLPLVRDAQTPSEAAAVLNQKIFPLLKVRYSTRRRRPDQGPYESIESGLASCTGLSILLIDACRSVGVPARFVGTPLWADRSGNHSWVEIWDDGWHFTGAAEPTGKNLNKAWFTARASRADREHPLHAIYAVSFRRTPLRFPLVWAPSVDNVWAVNVTDRYTRKRKPLGEGELRAMFRVFDAPGGSRQAADIVVRDAAGNLVFKGRSNDERFDANNHLTAVLKEGKRYEVEGRCQDRSFRRTIRPARLDELFTFVLDQDP